MHGIHTRLSNHHGLHECHKRGLGKAAPTRADMKGTITFCDIQEQA